MRHTIIAALAVSVLVAPAAHAADPATLYRTAALHNDLALYDSVKAMETAAQLSPKTMVHRTVVVGICTRFNTIRLRKQRVAMYEAVLMVGIAHSISPWYGLRSTADVEKAMQPDPQDKRIMQRCKRLIDEPGEVVPLF